MVYSSQCLPSSIPKPLLLHLLLSCNPTLKIPSSSPPYALSTPPLGFTAGGGGAGICSAAWCSGRISGVKKADGGSDELRVSSSSFHQK